MASPAVTPAVVRVRLFARYADLLGLERVDLPAAGLATAGAVLERIRALPGGDVLGSATLIAVNLKQAALDAPVVAGDEVAILPPLSGG